MRNKPIVWLRSLHVNAGKHLISNNLMLLNIVQQQSGAVLIISLIILLLLTLIGSSSIQTSSLEEKMAGNLRDRNIAFQAAESALRDAERDINNSVDASAPRISGISDFVADCGASTSITSDDGLCYNGRGGYGTPIWTTANMTGSPSVEYGTFTGSHHWTATPTPPRYLIEGYSGTDGYYYRITARAQGINANTVVWLQAVFKK